MSEADVFNWICSVVARFAASRRSAQLTSADLCLDFLYRNPLLGGAARDGVCLLLTGLPRQGLLHFAMQLGNFAAKRTF